MVVSWRTASQSYRARPHFNTPEKGSRPKMYLPKNTDPAEQGRHVAMTCSSVGLCSGICLPNEPHLLLQQASLGTCLSMAPNET